MSESLLGDSLPIEVSYYHKEEKISSNMDSTDFNELLVQSKANLADDELNEQSEVKTNVALPFFSLRRDRNPNKTIGKKKVIYENEKKFREEKKSKYWRGEEGSYDNEKKFKCDHCMYSSHQRSHLKKHVDVIHMKVEKKFKCDKCPYASHTSYHLNEHVSVKHNKAMSFACEECSFVANCRGALSKHRRHAGHNSRDRKFSCKVCSYSSGDKDTLFEHIKDKHF